MMTAYQILDDSLIDQIAGLSKVDQGAWLILSPHPDFQGAWYVDSLDPGFLFDFIEIVGEYRTLFPSDLAEFQVKAEELEYHIAWTELPTGILTSYEALNELPPFSIQSELEGNINGFLPWQIVGFNKLIKPDGLRGGLCFWDTGTGKTVFVAMSIMWHVIHRQEADIALVVVKSNNKRDMQRKLYRLAGIQSRIIDGLKSKRGDKYVDASDVGPHVLITNYEKFREDQAFFEALFENRRILILWDEMPMKLSHRDTKLYKAIKNTLYEPSKSLNWDKKRPSWLRQYELTATPIEGDPGGQFSCVRLIDPDVLGNITKFEKEHVLSRNFVSKAPERWTRIDKMGHKLQFMTHRVDKTQPEVAKYFPEIIEDTIYIDWNPAQRKVYDALASKAILMLEEGEKVNVLSMITVLQMICDAPEIVNSSALKREKFEAYLRGELPEFSGSGTGSEIAWQLVNGLNTKITNEGHTKFWRLKEDLTVRHPDSKVLIFSTWGDYIFPIFRDFLNKEGITYEEYRGTDKQRQSAKDRWRSDNSIRVLVASDAGSDSVDLPEANVVINFNLPWLYARKYQRNHRASRADSIHDTLYVYNYCMAESVEERREELNLQRFGYHQDFLGTSTKSAISGGYSMNDLMYILTNSGDLVQHT